MSELSIGLDTGGTFTDAVAMDSQRRVVASAKALTTHWDLAIGLSDAIHALLQKLPAEFAREDISLVSVSTTLATNAVVENRFSHICTLLIGFDDAMVERSSLKRAGGGVIVRVTGGHDATGTELAPLDYAAIDAAVREFAPQVDAFAVAGLFSVRNPAHEERARERILAACDRPVTCSHELSSQLDASTRALTAALNARLTSQIRRLLDALQQVLRKERIAAPLMIVKGDGTLMRAEVALEYPVETVLSGPAASVVGAGYLSGLTDFTVSDMGGTTTDVAVVIDGRPVVNSQGAVIGGWRTMVEAIDVRTCGLGGDSEIGFNRDRQLTVGPRKALPLSLLAHQCPDVLPALRRLARLQHLPQFAPQFAFRNDRAPQRPLDRLEQRAWDAMSLTPRPMGEVASSTQAVEAVRRLVDRGLATIATFTPSDAMHVLGRQQGWDVEAARLGAAVLAIEERNMRAASEADSPERICERAYEHVVRQSCRIVLETALAQDPGVEAKNGSWGPLGVVVDRLVAGQQFSALVDMQVKLASSLIAIGAPVGAYYPEIARRLGADLLIPQHAPVCNAVGAVAGVVSETAEVLVNQITFKVFRVHDPAGSRDYSNDRDAIEDATRVSRELALAAARRAGALDPHVQTSVSERRSRPGETDEYLAEAAVRSRATGRPAAGHKRSAG